MLKAAEFWAQARKMGKPGADNAALDGDVILAAQVAVLVDEGAEVVVAFEPQTSFPVRSRRRVAKP
jgi:hypothetical protein